MANDYRIERWTERGVTTFEEPTKRAANTKAASLRSDSGTIQTIVVFPNGKVRVCRNPKFKGK